MGQIQIDLDIHVDNLIREQHLDPFGISLSQAETVLQEHHDYKKVMRIQQLPTIILFLKKMNGHYLMTKSKFWNAPVYDIEDVFKEYVLILLVVKKISTLCE